MSTATIDAPAPFPVPDAPCEPLATCEQVRAIMDTAPRRSACKKDLSGRFTKLPSSFLASGFVRFEYTKRRPDDPEMFFSKPCYFPIASRHEGRWWVTCDCPAGASGTPCKHANFLRALIPHWYTEDTSLVPFLPGDDGKAGRCHLTEECPGELYRAPFYVPGGPGYQPRVVCDACGKRGV